MTMHLPIIIDGIKVLRKGKEGREYEVTPGTDTATLVAKKRTGGARAKFYAELLTS